MTKKSFFLEKIRTNVLFQSVEESVSEKVINSLKAVEYPAGKIIFEDNTKGNCLYLVLAGSVKISKQPKIGEEIILGILHDGDFFGEVDLIDRRQRSARATAVTGCTFARLGRREFDFLLRNSREFALNLLHMVTLRLRSNNLTYVQHQESNLIAVQQQLEKTLRLVEASKIINSSLDIDKLLDLIFRTAAKTVGADRGTLYLIDEISKEIWSKVQQGSDRIEIRLAIGSGIAGSVAATGETVNIQDAYKDSRFNPKIDQITGYRTKSTLCMPMKNRDRKIIGVFQLLNKAKGFFTKEDESFIEAYSIHASIAVANAQLAQQMVQSERLSAVGRMASGIIHDIKNPMGILRISAQVIKKKAENEEAIRLAGEMIQQVDRFMAMTQEILDFARGVSVMNLQKLDFNELIETLIVILERDLGRRNVKLIKNFDYSGNITVDPDKLLRVFYNIASNAVDAMPDTGKLMLNILRKDKWLVVEFIDKGCGMNDEVKAKIFEPFYTHGKKHGTGLGMSIVKKIMDDHKGKIEIESKVGKGSTIRLFLPL